MKSKSLFLKCVSLLTAVFSVALHLIQSLAVRVWVYVAGGTVQCDELVTNFLILFMIA